MNRSTTLSAAAAITLAILTVGCGRSANTVIATIKYDDGTPVTSGNVRLLNDNFETFGAISADGTVDLGQIDGGVPDGTYRVAIEAYNNVSDNDGDYSTPAVAPKYLSYETSGIEIEVADDQEVEIVVERADPVPPRRRRAERPGNADLD